MIRLAVAVLADAVNVRENMLSVLSGGVSVVNAERLPAALRLAVALMIEISADDLKMAGSRGVKFTIRYLKDGSVVMDGEGRVAWEPSDGPSLNIPMPIEIPGAEVQSSGAYEVDVAIEGLDVVHIPFVVNESS